MVCGVGSRKPCGASILLFILTALLNAPTRECLSPSNERYAYGIDTGFPSHRAGRVRRAERSGRGTSLNTWDCDTIIPIPQDIINEFILDGTFYAKYTHAYGIPVISSSAVSTDASLTRACYVVRFMLADRQDIRDALYDKYARVAVIALTERTTQIPEFSSLDPSYDERARGLGGTASNPVTINAEENLLCLSSAQDRWDTQDVLVHELAHTIHNVALNTINRSFTPILRTMYAQALAENLWTDTYAISSFVEYFGEAVKSFFNVQAHSPVPDFVYNNISRRDTLMDYDRRLYDLIAEVFPCQQFLIDRCEANQGLASFQVLRMNCNGTEVPTTIAPTTTVQYTTSLTESKRLSYFINDFFRRLVGAIRLTIQHYWKRATCHVINPGGIK